MQTRDFRSGNFLVLGSVYSNPWASLFEGQLNFQFDAQHSGQYRYGIRNVSPHAGEPSFYWSSIQETRNGNSYARIALLPNLSATGKVLLIAGQSVESSEGAEDAALSPILLRELQTQLHGRSLRDILSFEVLLEVHSVEGVARGTKVLAYRAR